MLFHLWSINSVFHKHLLNARCSEDTKGQRLGTSLAVQWLRLCASNAGGTGSIPGQGTTAKNKKKTKTLQFSRIKIPKYGAIRL